MIDDQFETEIEDYISDKAIYRYPYISWEEEKVEIYNGYFTRLSTKLESIRINLSFSKNREINDDQTLITIQKAEEELQYCEQLFHEHGDLIWGLKFFIGDLEILGNFTEFPEWLSSMPFLHELSINIPTLTSLKHIPATLHRLHIKNTPLQSFFGYPSAGNALRWILIYNCPIITFNNLPPVLPHLTGLELHKTRLPTFVNMPSFPALTHFKIENNYELRNFAGLLLLIQRDLVDFYTPNTFISLYGISSNVTLLRNAWVSILLNYFHNNRAFPTSYLDVFQIPADLPNYLNQAMEIISDAELLVLHQNFAPSPLELAQKYVSLANSSDSAQTSDNGSDSIEVSLLSPFERDRIIHEGCPEVLHYLRGQMGSHNIIVKNLSQRLHFPKFVKFPPRRYLLRSPIRQPTGYNSQSPILDCPPVGHEDYPLHIYDTSGLLPDHRRIIHQFRHSGWDMIDTRFYDIWDEFSKEDHTLKISGAFTRLTDKVKPLHYQLRLSTEELEKSQHQLEKMRATQKLSYMPLEMEESQLPISIRRARKNYRNLENRVTSQLKRQDRVLGKINYFENFFKLHGDFIWEMNLFDGDLILLPGFTAFPEWFAKMPLLHELRITLENLSSLEHIPPILHKLMIEYTSIESFLGYPSNCTELRRLDVYKCSIRSVYGLPPSLPHLHSIDFEDCPIETFAHMPEVPVLERLSIDGEIKLRDYAGLIPLIQRGVAKFYNSTYLISFHGIPADVELLRSAWRSLLDTYRYHSEIFPLSYLEVFHIPADLPIKYGGVDLYRADLGAIAQRYKEMEDISETKLLAIQHQFTLSSMALAQKYIAFTNSGSFPLSKFEQDRIIFEGTPEVLNYLIGHLGSDNGIVQQIGQKLHITPKLGQLLR
jgi:hypothetical protein